MARNKLASWLERLTLTGAAARAAAAPPAAHVAEERINPSVRYEPHDLYPRAVLYTGLGVLFSIWLISALLFPFYRYLGRYRDRTAAPPLPVRTVSKPLPPEPRIQQSPTLDMQALRRRENAALSSYAWVDRGAGVVSIPIDDAIRITAQRGIPPQPDPGGDIYYDPQAGTLETGLGGKVQPER